MRLSAKDIDALQRAILALHDCRRAEAISRELPNILQKLIPADHFYLFEFKFSPKMDGAKLVRKVDPSGQITGEMARFAEETLLDHPFPKYFARTGDRTALKMSDFHTIHQFRKTETYQRFYRLLGVERQLAMPADFGPRAVGGITLGRKRNDFTERDRTMMNLLCPHIELAHRNARRWTALRELCRKPAVAELKFTPRETEIGRWLAAGKTNPEIAFVLGASARTVEKHVENILEKLGVENRTTAAVVIAKAGGLEIPPVVSAETAVRVQIVKDVKGKK